MAHVQSKVDTMLAMPGPGILVQNVYEFMARRGAPTEQYHHSAMPNH